MWSLEKVELHIISFTPRTESLIFPCLILGLLNSDSKLKLYIRHRIKGNIRPRHYDHRKPKLTILGKLITLLNFPLQQRGFSAAEDSVIHTVIIIVHGQATTRAQEQHIVNKHMLRHLNDPARKPAFFPHNF